MVIQYKYQSREARTAACALLSCDFCCVSGSNITYHTVYAWLQRNDFCCSADTYWRWQNSLEGVNRSFERDQRLSYTYKIHRNSVTSINLSKPYHQMQHSHRTSLLKYEGFGTLQKLVHYMLKGHCLGQVYACIYLVTRLMIN